MHGILRPRPTLVRPTQAKVDVDLDALTTEFLVETRASALGRFEGHRIRSAAPSNVLAGECHTVERAIAPGEHTSGGTIVAHISGPAFAAWAASEPGYPA